MAEELDLGNKGLVKVVDGGGGKARLLKVRRSVKSIDSKKSMKRRKKM